MSPIPPTNAIDDAGRVPGLCAALAAQGYAIVDDLLPRDLVATLAIDCDAAEAAGALRAAGTGRGRGHHVDLQRRGDAILWLERTNDASAGNRFLDAMDTLRIGLNRRLMLGLHELEAHFAVYPAGAGYARHRDRFRDDDARVLSLVVYLNPGWQAEDRGELRLHLPEGPLDVLPRAGTAVLFLSAEIEHEVLPARHPRRSIAGWFRRRAPIASG
jgi:SM-20-related protein